MVPSDRATKPAKGPNPKSLTANIAKIISGKVREAAIIPLQKRYTHAGVRFLAAPRPIGMDRSIPAAVEIIAIQTLSMIPSHNTPRLSEKLGGKKSLKTVERVVVPL